MTATETLIEGGYRLRHYKELGSTNSEALRLASDGAPGKLWVHADRQSAGRGRSGREWQSQQGNLFASLLLRPDCPLETSVQLAFVAGLAAFDAIAEISRDLRDALTLKWPNDLLLGMQKLGGMLLESAPSGGQGGYAVVLGTGLNLNSHPDNTQMPATDLARHGVTVTADEAMIELAGSTSYWLDIWENGEGWQRVRSAWRERSLPAGSQISVKCGGKLIAGKISGIDDRGALLIDAGGREPVVVTAGDVFLL